MMTTHEFHAEQWLPRPRAEVFPFFADARNLETITPGWLHFQILTPAPIAMRVGCRIDYRLRVHGLPLRWQSEITVWEPPDRFVDEQRRGPYRYWRHEHTFRDHEGGTLCADHVRYAVPGGALVHRLFVKRDVERIFAWRRQLIEQLLGGHRPADGLNPAPGVVSPA